MIFWYKVYFLKLYTLQNEKLKLLNKEFKNLTELRLPQICDAGPMV